MKTRKQLCILIVLTLLTFSSVSFAQGPHIVTLNVDTNELNNNNKDAAFSFQLARGRRLKTLMTPKNLPYSCKRMMISNGLAHLHRGPL